MSETLSPPVEREILHAQIPQRRTISVPLVDLEYRGAGDGNGFILTGHAAVFDQETTLYAGKGFRITESIAPGAFDSVLASNPDVHLNINHDMSKPMARTGRSANTVGGLELSVDPVGLRVFARVNPDITYVRDLSLAMRDGVVDQMSFAFSIGEESLTTTTDSVTGMETDSFRILSVANLYDCTVCAQGAYPTTDVALHSRMQAAGRTPPGEGRDRTIAETGGSPSIAEPPGAESLVAARRLAALRLKARVALTPYKEMSG
jgi:HK97 family phage prohead protease